MNWQDRRCGDQRTLLAGPLLAFLLVAPIQFVEAQLPGPTGELPLNISRIEWLETPVLSQLPGDGRLAGQDPLLSEEQACELGQAPRGAAWNKLAIEPLCTTQEQMQACYWVGYENGFVIRPDNLVESPFSLRINNQTTFRYSGFARDETSWIDSAGNVNPIFNNSNFLIPRGRLILSGNAFLPEVSYLLNIDYNTATNNPIGFRAYSLSYRFSRGLEAHVGQNKVPGSREWIGSSFVAQAGPDRSMATTFFRPSLSQGIWLTGEPRDGVHYQAMLSNGFNTLNLRPSQLDKRLCWSGSTWWEPRGSFGAGYSDIEAHEQPVVRLGSSFTYSLEQGSQSSDSAENSSLRLSDGTLITLLGAFAPGVTLREFDVSLAAVDLAYKYNGLSLATEIYWQEFSSLEGDGPLPIHATRAVGGVCQGGWFIIPQSVELYARTSFVTGAYGSGNEIAGGLNWFVLAGQSNLRFTFDTAWLESSPADQNRTGFTAGQTGALIRTQITSSF